MSPARTATPVTVVAAQLAARVPGGTGRYTRELVRALAATAEGRPLRALAPREGTPGEHLEVPVRRLPVPARLLPPLWERSPWPRAARAGVVHAPTLLVPPPVPGVGLVVTCHDVVPWTHPGTLTPRGVAFHHRMGERAAAHADVVVTPTAAVAEQVRRVLAPRGEVVPVLPGVSTLPPLPPDEAAARRTARGVPTRYALFVGTAEPRKGLDVLLAALARPDTGGLALVVVGPAGWGDVDVADLARRAGVAARVLVTGRVDDADLAALYAGAAVVVMPSRAEGFGLPVVEAFAAGAPVVTSDDPALVEVGAGGALVAPREDEGALAAALAEATQPGPGARERLHRAADRAAELTWTATARRLWEVYEDVGGRTTSTKPRGL